jgi:hypothetical protein
MMIRFNPSAWNQGKWYEYALRFLLGGSITAINGFIGKKFGPLVGGLFLAFPAILPATLTLVEKHERQKKERAGLNGTKRGCCAAILEARGAAMGAIGSLAFAVVVWQFLPGHEPWIVLAAATLSWLGVSVLLWLLRQKM